MYVTRLSPIDWLQSMDRLSVGAFYLLNIMYRKDIDMNDNTLMDATGIGLSTHRKHKKELVDHGYLTVNQVGRGEYQYTIGDVNGK